MAAHREPNADASVEGEPIPARKIPQAQADPRRKTIWSHLFGWNVLFDWEVVGWTEALLLGGALAVIGIGYAVPVKSGSPWFTSAQAGLAVAGILFLAKIIEIVATTNHPFWERAVFTVVLFGAVGLLTAEGIRGINRIRPKPEPKDGAASTPSEGPGAKTTLQSAGFVTFLGQIINGAAPMIQINQTDTPLDNVKLIVTQSLLKNPSDAGPWQVGWQKEIEIGTCRAKLTSGLNERFPIGSHNCIRFDIFMLTRLRTYREVIRLTKTSEKQYDAELSFFDGASPVPSYVQKMALALADFPKTPERKPLK